MPSEAIFKYALEQCSKSQCDHKLSAVLYKGGAIIRCAYNTLQTINYRKGYFTHGEPSRHAEMNALHGVDRKVINGSSMLVVRLDKNGNLKSAKPCYACGRALYDAGVRKVFYTSYNGTIKKLNFSEYLNGTYEKESTII